MSACNSLRHIMIDKKVTITSIAEQMGKARQTVANTFYNGNPTAKSLIEYGNVLNCSLCYIDNDTGKVYKVEM